MFYSVGIRISKKWGNHPITSFLSSGSITSRTTSMICIWLYYVIKHTGTSFNCLHINNEQSGLMDPMCSSPFTICVPWPNSSISVHWQTTAVLGEFFVKCYIVDRVWISNMFNWFLIRFELRPSGQKNTRASTDSIHPSKRQLRPHVRSGNDGAAA